MDNNELTHWGIKGMRWGVRRWQNKDGSLTPQGKKKYNSDEEKAANEKAAKEKYEADKQRAVKSGSAEDVLKFKGDLTKAEMDSAIQRIRWEQDMSSLAAKEASGKQKSETVLDKMDKVSGGLQTLSKTYNSVANIINAFMDKDSPRLPTIQVDNTKENRSLRKAEEKAKQKEAEEAKEKAKAKSKAEAEEKKKADIEEGNKKYESYKIDQEHYRDLGNKKGVTGGEYRNAGAGQSETVGKRTVKGLLGDGSSSSNTSKSNTVDVEIIQPKKSSWTKADRDNAIDVDFTPVSSEACHKVASLGESIVAGYLESHIK
jgi:membrane protein involved in colicin uptake